MRIFGEKPGELDGASLNQAMRSHVRRRHDVLTGDVLVRTGVVCLGVVTAALLLWWAVAS